MDCGMHGSYSRGGSAARSSRQVSLAPKSGCGLGSDEAVVWAEVVSTEQLEASTGSLPAVSHWIWTNERPSLGNLAGSHPSVLRAVMCLPGRLAAAMPSDPTQRKPASAAPNTDSSCERGRHHPGSTGSREAGRPGGARHSAVLGLLQLKLVARIARYVEALPEIEQEGRAL